MTLPPALTDDAKYMALLRLSMREMTPAQREDVETLIALAFMLGTAAGIATAAETMRGSVQ